MVEDSPFNHKSSFELLHELAKSDKTLSPPINGGSIVHWAVREIRLLREKCE